MGRYNHTKQIFNNDQISNWGGFVDSIRQVHIRLLSEGYTIKDGKIYPPEEKNYEKQKTSE